MILKFCFWFIMILGLCYMCNTKNITFPKTSYLIKSSISSLLDNIISTAGLVGDNGHPCLQGFRNLKNNAVPYFDSMGKLGAGIENGNTFLLGSYSECMSLPAFHFCTLSDIMIAQKLSITLGVCMPESCTSTDLVNFLKGVANLTKDLNSTAFSISNQGILSQLFGVSDTCYKNGKKEFLSGASTGSRVMVVISIILASLCLCGSAIDVLLKYLSKYRPKIPYEAVQSEIETERNPYSSVFPEKTSDKSSVNFSSSYDLSENALVKFFLCFSMIRNLHTLFDTNIPDNSITSIHGLRVISITWVMLGHSLIFGLPYYDDIVIAISWTNQYLFQAIDNAMVSVDTFFLLSGLLVAYLSMKRYKKAGNLSLFHFYIHRYLRLTPSYIYATFFYAYLFPLLSDGPLWYTQNEDSIPIKSCVKYWWTNLLYINNFYPELANMCLNWSWYLSNDMQFYVVSPIILYVMHRFQLRGTLIINGIIIILCMIANGLLIDHYDGNPLISSLFTSLSSSNSMPGYLSYTQNIYMKPYARIISYAVGLILGFLLFKEYKFFTKKKYVKNIAGWAISIAVALAVVYGPYSTTKHTWSKAEIITYGVSFRFVWCLAVGWVIYACHNGYGGYVNSILSWKTFIPLSRLSYSTYLVHPFVIYLFFASSQVAVHMTLLTYAYHFAATVVLSFSIAVILVLVVEYPVFNLEKLVLKV